MKKNIIAIILTATLITSLALTGCGNTSDVDSTEAVVESTEEAVDEDATEEAFVEGEDLSEESTEDVESTEVEDAENENAGTNATASASYTYTDASKTMYAKSSVNVRDLPSSDGNKLGGLSTNQEVTVTGQCNETGWYRIEYKGSTGYVSNKYLSDEKVATTSTGSGSGSAGTSASAGSTTSTDSTASTSASTVSDGFDRAAAEAVWAKVNAERAAAGLNTLAWDEAAYSNACTRAQQIVSDFSHNGKTYAGENCEENTHRILSADEIHQNWHDSTGHYNNYMYAKFASGACAVYYYNGGTYATEEFSYPSSNETYTVNDAESAAAAGTSVAPAGSWTPTGTPWTASNGVTLYVNGDGSYEAAPGTDSAAVTEAVKEYLGL
jgi:uncharacterized protein YkwD